MRIGIEASRADFLGRRGMERYTNSLLQALSKVDSRNEYVLFSQDDSLRDKFSLSENFRIEHPGRRFRMIFRRGSGFIGRLLFRDIDIFHFPNSYAWHSKYAMTVVTLQDIAPLHFPQYFFDSKRSLLNYKNNLFYVKKNADKVITVSQYSKLDIMKELDLSGDRIEVIYSAFNSKFRPINVTEAHIADLKRRFNINIPFVLFVGGLDFRKDVGTLLKAFDAVVRKNSFRHKLVIAGSTLDDSRLRIPLEDILRDLNIKERIIFTGPLNDDDLLILYNSAELFVFPSIFEGFGFPVLESMACGCPTISSNAASLPEVAGSAAILVKPGDASELENKITEVLSSLSLRQELREKGLKRAQDFSWEKAAQEVISVYDNVHKYRFRTYLHTHD